MLKRILLIVAGLLGLTVVVLGGLVWGSQEYLIPRRPDIPFAPLQDTALKDPDNPTKVFRIDMAKVEQEVPLTRAHLASLYPEHIRALRQEELDQLYGRLAAGPIPDGAYQGDLVFPRGDDSSARQEVLSRLKRLLPFVDAGPPPRLEEALGGVKGRLAGDNIKLLEKIGRSVWKGKYFYRDTMVLRNFTENFPLVEEIIRVDDRKSVEQIKVPRLGWLRYFSPMTTVNLLFPAKLHCGQSLLDGRRESIIIDYAFNDEVKGYQKNPDSLVGRNGLRVRDEVRMVRPGFYLGRAYANRILVVNFTLFNPEVAKAGLDGFSKGAPTQEDCWSGEQLRHAAKN
jgi:hypothetical protein